MSKLIRAFLLVFIILSSYCVANAQLSLTTTSPTFNEQNVSATTDLVFTFSEAVSSESLTAESIIVFGEFQGPIAGSITGGGTNIITFSPTGNLLPGEKVTVTVSSQIQNLSGTALTTPAVYQFDVMSEGAANEPPYYRQGKSVFSGAARSFQTIDMDGDGDMDIATYFFSGFGWFENDGLQNFTYHQVERFSRISGMKAGDLDSDGDIDIVISALGSTYLYQNDGNQDFTQVIISENQIVNIDIADLNGDGHMDLSGAGNTILINDGALEFTFTSLGSLNASSVQSRTIVDIDNDGDLDLLGLGQFPNQIEVFTNDGAASFSSAFDFSTISIGRPDAIIAGDVDGDEDIDLLAYGVDPFVSGLDLFVNDGSENFTVQEILPLNNFLYFLVNSTNHQIDLKDADGDGDLDILIFGGADNSIVLLVNDGMGNYRQDFIATGAEIANVRAAKFADMDQDGDLDLLVQYENGLVIFENAVPEPPAVRFTVDYEDAANGTSVDLGNIVINEDRLVPLQLINSGEARLIVENINATGGAVIDGTADTLFQNFTANLSLSIPTDVLGAASTTISFTSNADDATSFSIDLNYSVVNAMAVTSTLPASGSVHQEMNTSISVTFDEEIDAANPFTDLIKLTGSISGNLDFTASASGNTVELDPTQDLHPGERVSVTLTSGIQSSGGLLLEAGHAFHFDVKTGAAAQTPLFFRTKKLIDHPFNFSRITQADYNQDGKADFLVNRNREFNLINQLADNSFEIVELDLGSTLTPSGLITSDFNNDGYPDVLLTQFTSNSSGGVGFLVNDQQGSFSFTGLPITGNLSSQAAVTDIDRDGLLDVVLFKGKDLFILLNEGDFNFREILVETDLPVSSRVRSSIVATDMDGDGSTDIVAELGNGFGVIYWFQNDGFLNFTSNLVGSTRARDLFVTDFDNDADLDIVLSEATPTGFKLFANDGNQSFSAIASFGDDFEIEHLVDLDGDQDFDGLAFEINSSNMLLLANEDPFAVSAIDPDVRIGSSLTMDFDGDGDLDVVAMANVNQVNQLMLFENDAPTPPEFQLSIKDRLLSSGDTIKVTLSEGLENAFSFQVKNLGEASLLIDSIHRNDDFMLVDPTPIALASNREQQVRFTLSPQTEGNLLDSVTFRYNIPGDSITRIYFDLVIEPSLSIVSSTPEQGADLVAPGTEKITITVNEDLMAETINEDHIKVYGKIAGPIAGQLALESATTISFTPNSNFITSDDITLVLTEGVTAVSGNRFIRPQSLFFEVGQKRQPTEITGFDEIQIASSITGFTSFGDFDQSGITEVYYGNFSSGMRIDGFEVETPVSIDMASARQSIPGDIDNDGDLDIIYRSFDNLFWVENDNGTFATIHEINEEPFEIGDLQLGDINGDGRLDIITLTASSGAIAAVHWFENSEDGFIKQEVAVVQSNLRYLNVLDFDQDGDLDLLYTGILVTDIANNRTVLWSENLGNGTFKPFVSILGGLNINRGTIIPTDFDQDEDIDLFVNEAFGGILYLENNGMMQFTQSQFSNDKSLAQAADVDADSDIDLLMSNGAWMINEGNGTFSEILLRTGTNDFGTMQLLDYNGDGDLDVVSQGFSSGNIRIFELRRPAELQVTNEGTILANAETLDFGVTSAGNSTQQQITLSNIGEETLVISDATLPSGYTFDPVLPAEIEAGASFSTAIVFEQATTGTFSGNLELTIESLPSYSLALTATVELAAEISLSFEDVELNSGDKITLTGSHTSPLQAELIIKNIGDQELTLSDPTLSTGLTQIGNLVNSLGFGTDDADTLRLDLSTEEVGLQVAELSISNDDPDENPFTLTVEWEVTPAPEVSMTYDDAELSQEAIISLSAAQNTELAATVTITNTGTADLELTDPSLSELVMLQTSLPSTLGFETDNSVDAVFILDTETPGSYSETVSIDNNDLDEDPLTFTIEWEVTPTPEVVMSYEGEEISNDAIITALTAAQNTELQVTVTISNTGTADLELNAPVLSELVDLEERLPATVGFESDNSTEAIFRLSTETPGSYSETINIDNNDLDEDPLTFTIEWEVTPTPEVAISYETVGVNNNGIINGFTAEQNTELQATVTISNIGTADLELTEPSPGDLTTLQTTLPSTLGFETDNTVDAVFLLNTENPGFYSETISIDNNDLDENPLVFTFEWEVTPTPEVSISYEGEVLSNDAIITGLTAEQTTELQATVTISNVGTADLELTSPMLSELVTLQTDLPSTLGFESDNSVDAVFLLSTDTPGSYSETISIDNNDLDEDPLTFTIEWEVAPIPEVSMSYEGNEISNDEIIGGLTAEQTTELQAVITISNTGNADLELTNPTLSELVALEFDLPATLGFESENSVEAVFILNTDTPGSYSETISISNNDLDEDPLTFTLEWEVTPTPEVVMTFEDAEIANGELISLSAIQTTELQAIITISNTGTANLELTNPTLSEQVTLETALPATLGFESSNSVEAVFILNTDSPGTYSETINISNNDLDENPLAFTLEWEVTPTPEVSMSYQGAEISNEEVISGLTAIENNNLKATITITNTGTADLELTNPTLSESVSLESDLPATVSPDNSTDAVFILNTTTPGSYSETINIANNDLDEDPLTFTIEWEVLQGGIAIFLDGDRLQQTDLVNFGSIMAGNTEVRSFTIVNNENEPVTIQSVDLPAGFNSSITDPVEIPGGEELAFEISLVGPEAEFYQGTVTVVTSNTDFDQSFEISGNVIAPEFSLEANNLLVSNNETIDFGTALVDNPATVQFVFTNIGLADLILSDVQLSGEYQFADGFPTTVSPFSNEVFSITLPATELGTFDGVLSFSTNDPSNPSFVVNLTGSVTETAVPDMTVFAGDRFLSNNSLFSFGAASSGGVLFEQFKISNQGTATLSITDVELVSNSNFVLVENSGDLSPGESLNTTVVFSEELTGEYRATLTITSNDPEASEFVVNLVAIVTESSKPTMIVTSEGVELNTADVLNFGEKSTNSTVTRTIEVFNAGNAALEIGNFLLPTGYSIESPFQDGSGIIQAGSAATLQVLFDATTAGTFEGTMSFSSNDEESTTFELQLTGKVNTPAAMVVTIDDTEVSSGSVNALGSTTADEPITVSFAIGNNGEEALTLSDFTLSDGFSFNEDFPSSIAPGEVAALTLSFESEVIGDFNGTLSFNTNDPENTSFALDLTATVTPVTSAEQSIVTALSIYPNPTTDKVFVKLTDGYSGAVTLSISDLSGKRLMVASFSKRSETEVFSLSPGQLPAGIYQVTIEKTDGVYATRSLIVK